MLSDFRFRRGGVSARFLEISILIGVLFVAGCTTNRGVAQFSVTTTSGQLATAIINAVYPQTTLTAANGTAPYTWAIASGALPTGLTLSPSGVLSGTPTAFGTFNFTVTVTDSATPTPHTATANLSVLINPALASVALNPTTVTGGISSTGTVTLTGAAAAAATVTLSSNNGVAVVPATATVAAGQTSGTFQVTTNAVSASTPATITATYGVAKTATLTVNPPVVSMVTLAQSTVTGGTSTTGTVTLSGPAATGGDVVTLSSTNAAATPQATVTVAAGASTAQFNVTTVTVTTTATGNIQASFNSSSPTAALTVVPAPTITSFTATATTITAGGSTTLTGLFSNGTGSVSNGVGAVTSGTAVTVSPATTTTYTLTVTNAAGTLVTKQATVTVVAAPAITSFTPAAATITAGSSTTLTGVFSNGTGSVDNGVGAVTSGTAVTVSPSATTTYTLTVTNTAGASVTKQATVTVVPAPAITSFVSAAATITAGTSTTLTAVFSNGTGSVDNGVGAVTSATPVTVSPAATTTYTLTVTNAANTSVTRQVTVTVVAAPAITSFTAAAPTITAGTSTTLTAVFNNGTGNVDTGVGAVTSGTPVTVSPSSTTTYTLTVMNTAGATVTKPVTVTVVPAPAITSFTPGTPTIVSGNSTTLTAVFSGGTGSVNNGVGAVSSGTPVSISPVATTTYTLTVTNTATTPATVTATTTVTVNVPPTITTANNATFTVGSAGTFTVRTAGNPIPSLNATGTLPPGTVTFHDNGDGTATISGTPTGAAADYPLTITANNGVTPNASQSFTLHVVLVQAPTITSATAVTFTAGSSGTFTVTSTGSPTPALSKTGSLPTGVNFTDNGNGTATISGSAAAVSSSSITISASNGTLPNATQSFTFNVVAAPSITSFTAAAPTITAGGSTTLTGVFTGGTGSVNNAVGAVTTGTSASISPSVTTTYTLTVTNAATTPVSVTATATVTVVAAPVITSFTGTTTIVSGNSTTITPTFSNGTGSISPTVGAVTSGTGYSVSPTATTTYTLTVTNSAGSKTTSTVTITVNVPPQITSLNNATFTVGVNGSFTVNTTGTLPMTLTETGSLPSPITFVDNGNGTATISGTPTGASVTPITITASNGFGSNATQSFTLNVTNNSGQISGQISLNNPCGGSVTLPTFTVTISTTPPQQVQTDTSGNYSFTSIPNGTYTITPSISGAASSVFSPASYAGVVVNSGSLSGENFNAAVGYNVSGTVSYSGSQTGQTYLYLQSSNCGGFGAQGTSIAQAGAYTIHSVPPGNYTLYAWMDSTGVTSGTKYPGAQGQQNTNDPTGSTSNVSVTTASVTGVGVTMTSPTYSTPSSNPAIQVFPSAGGVAIFYQPSTVKTANGNKVEDANEYVVQWAVPSGLPDGDGNPTCPLVGGTGGGQFATLAGSHTFYGMGAHGGTVWILNNTVTGASNFTSGQSYCFQARSFNTLATTQHPTGWSNYNVDSLGNVVPVTIVANGAALCTSNCTTVSGTVTIPSGVTPVSGAPLYVGFYQQSASSNGPPTALYATEISPGSGGAKSYSITIPSGSNYYIFGILDQNNDGQIDAGDVTDTNNNNNAPAVTLSGSTMTVNDNSLPATNSVATVQTQYSTCGTNCSSYNLNLQVRQGNKLPVAVTLYSGPNLLNPVDMGQCSGCGTVQFQYSASLAGGVPTLTDTYKFTVTYSDGSVDQGSAGTINGKVTAFGSTLAVVDANDLPTNLLPSGTSSTSTTPNFTWTFPANPSNYTYSFYLSQNTGCSGNCTIWQIPGQNSNSNGFTYAQTQTGATTGQITWGTDPTGGGSSPSGPLISGDQYSWSISVQDTNGNQAQASVNYLP
jgi:hypothetical protein